MGKSNSNATKNKSGIPCVEVLISRNHLNTTNTNLHWTLSVYSLENQPVTKNRVAILDSEIFHFMVYDWNRTIRDLLEGHQIPYSVVRFFIPDTIYSEADGGAAGVPENAEVIATNFSDLSQSGGASLMACLPGTRDTSLPEIPEENANVLP